MINYTKEKQIYFFYQNCFQQYFKYIYKFGKLVSWSCYLEIIWFSEPKNGKYEKQFLI